MHVERTHKDGYHQSLVVEIGIFLGLLDYNNFTISRGHNQFISIAVEIANRTAIEVQRDKPGSTKYCCKYPEWHLVIKATPKQCPYAYNCQPTEDQFVSTLAMDSDLLEFLYSFSHELRSDCFFLGAKVHFFFEYYKLFTFFFWLSQKNSVPLRLKIKL